MIVYFYCCQFFYLPWHFRFGKTLRNLGYLLILEDISVRCLFLQSQVLFFICNLLRLIDNNIN